MFLIERKARERPTYGSIVIKHKVSGVRDEAKYVIISSVGIVPKATEEDVCNTISSKKKEKLRCFFACS
jgi:hypothetical protein